MQEVEHAGRLETIERRTVEPSVVERLVERFGGRVTQPPVVAVTAAGRTSIN
jgi:hypothetical protein